MNVHLQEVVGASLCGRPSNRERQEVGTEVDGRPRRDAPTNHSRSLLKEKKYAQ
jgi:hypothetical protein